MGVSKVMKEDGVFLLADGRKASESEKFETMLNDWFDVEREEDITDRVLYALRRDTPRMQTLIKESFPWSKSYSMIF